MLTSHGNKNSRCADDRIPKFVPIANLVLVSDLLDTNNTKIEHTFGDFTLTWSDKYPELVRLHCKSVIDEDTWIMRSQLAYVLERHRGAVRSRKELQEPSADTWDMSRLSMGKEICATLKTRGFYAPHDPGSADVISAVGMALSGIREPLLEFKHQQLLAQAKQAKQDAATEAVPDKERTEAVDDEPVTSESLLKLYRLRLDACDQTNRMFGRLMSSQGGEIIASFRSVLNVLASVLDASKVTISESRLKLLRERATASTSASKAPSSTVDVCGGISKTASDVVGTVTAIPAEALATPEGWLARPSSTNYEACALYDRIVEAVLAGKSINVHNTSNGSDIHIGSGEESGSDSSVVVVDTDSDAEDSEFGLGRDTHV